MSSVSRPPLFGFLIASILIAGSVLADLDYAIKLRTGDLATTSAKTALPQAAGLVDRHILVQFDGPITDADKAQLASAGIQVLEYVPNFAYTARVTKSYDVTRLSSLQVRWLGEIKPDYKISPYITEVGIRPWARRGGDSVLYTVVMHRDENIDRWSDWFATELGAEIVGLEPTTNAIELVIPEPAFYRLSELDAVVWIEPAPPEPIEYNNSARVNTNAEAAQVLPLSLTGNGVVVAEWDGGRADPEHADFGRRVISMDAATVATHATHVAGTVIGSGASSSGTYRGMAPEATLLTQLWWGSSSSCFSQYSTAINTRNAMISTNSWGYGVGDPATQSACEATLGNYYSQDATLDNIVRGSAGKPIVICWAAGNQRGTSSKYCGSLNWTWGTMDPLACSKNVISVGAINSNNSSMTSFSSWGPTDDGRLKPDVVGPGCQSNDDGGLTSTRNGGGYTVMCGTSMATPATAGVVALIRQKWNQNFAPSEPLPSTIKGVLINTAIDLGNAGPDFANGHGKIDAVAACTKIGIGAPSYQENQIATGQTQLYDLTVPSGAAKLKVTVVWDDPGGTGIAGKTLINDLDLTLIDPSEVEQYPWILNAATPSVPATKGADRLNNVETVEIDNPQPGLWKAKVNGYNIPNGPQNYSIVFSPDSINTPGSLQAVAVYGPGNQVEVAGSLVDLPFWVSNVGAATDSVRTTISDNRSWLTVPRDTTVLLAQYDSAYLSVSLQLPSGLLAGDSSLVTCRAVSRTDTTVVATSVIKVTVAAVHAVSMTPPPQDTVGSPESYPFDVMIRNTGNATNTITVSPTDQQAWNFVPTSRVITLAAGDSAAASFTATIPAEAVHLSTNLVTVGATSSGGATASSGFTLVVYNPYQPPTLLFPDSTAYQQSRTPLFEWTRGPGEQFRLYIAQDSLIAAPTRVYGGLTDTAFTIPPGEPLGDGIYYWAVRLYVGTDSSSLQRSPRRLGIDNTAPNPVGTVSPIGGIDSTHSTTFVLSGTPPPPYDTRSPEYNEIQVSRDSFFGTVDATLTQDALTISSGELLPQGRLYWRARRADLAGNATPFTATVNFLHDTELPLIPTMISPANSSTVGGNVVFRWSTGTPPPYERSAEFYFLHVSNVPTFFDYGTFADLVYADSLVLSGAALVEGTTYYWRVKTLDSAGMYSNYSAPQQFTYLNFICGDVDHNLAGPDISDLSYLVDFLFFGGSAPDPMAASSFDCNLTVDISDLTILVEYLFSSGSTLCCP